MRRESRRTKPSHVHLLATCAMHAFEEDFLCDALDLDEDIVESHLGSLMFETVFFRENLVSPQNMDSSIFSEPLKGFAMSKVRLAEILERKLARSSSFE